MEAVLAATGVSVKRLQTLDILSYNRAELGVAVVAIGAAAGAGCCAALHGARSRSRAMHHRRWTTCPAPDRPVHALLQLPCSVCWMYCCS